MIALLLGCSQKITYLESPPLSGAQTLVVMVREPDVPLRISVTAATAFELVLEQPSSNEVDVTVVEQGLLDGVEQGLVLAVHLDLELVVGLREDVQLHGLRDLGLVHKQGGLRAPMGSNDKVHAAAAPLRR